MSHMILELQAIVENTHTIMSDAGVLSVNKDGKPLGLADRIGMVVAKTDELGKAYHTAANTLDLMRDIILFNGFDLEEELKDAITRRDAEENSKVAQQ